jgi:hypothetical protein
MTARNTLLGLYEEWRVQTESEGEAIRAKDWSRVNQCQQAKLQLQPLIQDWTGAARREQQEQGRDTDALQRELRGLLQQLAQAEVRNQKWLAQHQTALETRRVELQQTARNLGRVRRSYGLLNQSVWQSYS